jgi:hypothetical protein
MMYVRGLRLSPAASATAAAYPICKTKRYCSCSSGCCIACCNLRQPLLRCAFLGILSLRCKPTTRALSLSLPRRRRRRAHVASSSTPPGRGRGRPVRHPFAHGDRHSGSKPRGGGRTAPTADLVAGSHSPATASKMEARGGAATRGEARWLDPTRPRHAGRRQPGKRPRTCDNPPGKIPYYRLRPIHFGR